MHYIHISHARNPVRTYSGITSFALSLLILLCHIHMSEYVRVLQFYLFIYLFICLFYFFCGGEGMGDLLERGGPIVICNFLGE